MGGRASKDGQANMPQEVRGRAVYRVRGAARLVWQGESCPWDAGLPLSAWGCR
jgi:hypothetical protein